MSFKAHIFPPTVEPTGGTTVTHHIKTVTDAEGVERQIPMYGDTVSSSFDHSKMRDLYELKTLLKNGTPLQRVNCNLDPETVDGLLDRSDKVTNLLTEKIVDYELEQARKLQEVEPTPTPSANE